MDEVSLVPMSYPSASLGRTLSASSLNAIRIGGDLRAAATGEGVSMVQPPTRRITHIIGQEFE
ncbi:hypothetical protein [Bosea sp. BK604]|uniref:hypothetical protein n=1 Tax=Bosea sp. BK604 TaxID=2512180 RepID=UPI00104B19BB|nr:hypothetical protein [Bosea sp. BK604]